MIHIRLLEIDTQIRALETERKRLKLQLRTFHPSKAYRDSVRAKLPDLLQELPRSMIAEYCASNVLDNQLSVYLDVAGWLWIKYSQMDHRSLWMSFSIQKEGSNMVTMLDYGDPGRRLKRWANGKSLHLLTRKERDAGTHVKRAAIHFATHPSFTEPYKLGHIVVNAGEWFGLAS